MYVVFFCDQIHGRTNKLPIKIIIFFFEEHNGIIKQTRTVLVFAAERKNNVNPRLQSQKKVNNIQPFLPSNWCTSDVSDIYQ